MIANNLPLVYWWRAMTQPQMIHANVARSFPSTWFGGWGHRAVLSGILMPVLSWLFALLVKSVQLPRLTRNKVMCWKAIKTLKTTLRVPVAGTLCWAARSSRPRLPEESVQERNSFQWLVSNYDHECDSVGIEPCESQVSSLFLLVCLRVSVAFQDSVLPLVHYFAPNRAYFSALPICNWYWRERFFLKRSPSQAAICQPRPAVR